LCVDHRFPCRCRTRHRYRGIGPGALRRAGLRASRNRPQPACRRTLRRRFPRIVGPDVKDICYATQKTGSRPYGAWPLSWIWCWRWVPGTAPTRAGYARSATGPVFRRHLVEGPSSLDPAWLAGKKSVCITAGASTRDPDVHERPPSQGSAEQCLGLGCCHRQLGPLNSALKLLFRSLCRGLPHAAPAK
jgi:hypothetical protein